MDIRVKVIPKSSKTELTGFLPDGTWKVKVAAAPEKGKANRALCEFIAEKLGVAKSKVRIVAGETSQLKTNSRRFVRTATARERYHDRTGPEIISHAPLRSRFS
jgi:uncharacterized protein (TIGR00251 family)